MEWIVGIGMLFGLLCIIAGIAALRTGWAPRWMRRHVTRPSLYGLGLLLVGLPVFVQGFFYFHLVASPSWEVRFFGLNAFLFSGLILIGVGQMRRRS
ncbi:hypothetical protein [Streptomyces sp. NPDC046821]|uniref:hypothetical protein n=1 Tax=Streptomyces sp. NPDC046821 TaxID=3154702 RepID=UPI0033C900E0